MARVVVVGGGWSGCAAALAARAGRRRRSGPARAHRQPARHGAGRRHHAQQRPLHGRRGNARNGRRRAVRGVRRDHAPPQLDFPGHRHASIYDVASIESAVKRRLLASGVEIWLHSRVAGIARRNGSIAAVSLENAMTIDGDVFVDTTGSFGPQSFCTETGNGCVMCIMRCPTFGPRVSLTGLARHRRKAGPEGRQFDRRHERIVRVLQGVDGAGAGPTSSSSAACW